MNNMIFRGKCKDNGKWIEGSLIKWVKTYAIYNNDIAVSPDGADIVIPESIAMYTGLKDSTKWDELTDDEKSGWINRCGIINWLDASKSETEWDGKRIFGSIRVDSEMSKGGNIIKFRENNIEDWVIGKIEYQGGKDYPAFDIVPHIDTDSNGLSYAMAVCEVKVIGDAFNNPELLGE